MSDETLPERKITLSEEEFAELMARVDSLEEDVKDLKSQLDDKDN